VLAKTLPLAAPARFRAAMIQPAHAELGECASQILRPRRKPIAGPPHEVAMPASLDLQFVGQANVVQVMTELILAASIHEPGCPAVLDSERRRAGSHTLTYLKASPLIANHANVKHYRSGGTHTNEALPVFACERAAAVMHSHARSLWRRR
jgi:hypothetical protein